MVAEITGFFDKATSTLSYLLADSESGQAAVIDPLLDYNPRSGRISTTGADRLIAEVERRGWHLAWVLETHPHADHLTACRHVKRRLGGRIGIGAGVVSVQKTWAEIYNLDSQMALDGSQFDRLFADGERFALGGLEIEVWHTPGHTPACVTYVVREAAFAAPVAAFIGDTLFMPDYGTARCDFPGGDAATLHRSISRILSLPDETRLYTCHDYQPGGRSLAYEATVAEQRSANVHLKAAPEESAFVALRRERDRALDAPELLLPALQVNLRGGDLPPAESNGTHYLKIPVNRF